MPEYLVLMKLNPSKIVDTLGDIRKLEEQPVSGVDLCYSMSIFGTWDIGVWVNAENSTEVLEFVQKKVRQLNGVTDVFTVPTFPHGNGSSKKKATASTPSEPL